MAAKRQKRKARRRERAAEPASEAAQQAAPSEGQPARPTPARYERSRRKDEAARAALKPLAKGERPTAVTVAAVVAAVLALAEVIAFAVSFDPDEPGRAARSVVVVPLLMFMAWGMWKAKYWAVLGMQALLAITVLFACTGMIGAGNLWALVLLLLTAALAGTLFWFLVKAMARIQMPERPGARPSGR